MKEQIEPITLEKHQSILLDMMIEFDAFCKENNIDYWLDGGTLLGCIRHQGFIPWDDDVDVIMPRNDYERFIGFESVGNRYPIITNSNSQSSFRCSYANIVDTHTVMLDNEKVQSNNRGVFMDIFPVDGLPNTDIIMPLLKTQRRRNQLLSLSNSKRPKIHSVKDLVKDIAWVVSKLFINPDKLADKITESAAKYDFYTSEFVSKSSFIMSRAPETYIWKKKWFEITQQGEFAGHLFNIPAGYHELLTTIYGDYMTLPPIEKRIGGHAKFIEI